MKKVYTVGIMTGAVLAVLGMVYPPNSAHALTVYEKDGLKHKIKGDWQIQLRQDYGHDQDLDVEYDDLELKNSVSYDLGNGLVGFGQLDFGFKNAADKSDSDAAPHLEEAYLGMSKKLGEKNKVIAQFGKSDSSADLFGIEKAIESPLGDDEFDIDGAVDGDDLIKAGASFGMVDIVTSYELAADSEKSKDNGEFFDVFVGTSFAGLDLGFAYQDYEAHGASESIGIWGVSIAYDAEFAEFAVDYSDAEDTASLINATVSIPVGKTIKIAGGYQYQDFEDAAIDEIGAWYANVTYKFPTAKNFSVFAEIGDTDEDNSDMGYLAGIRMKF